MSDVETFYSQNSIIFAYRNKLNKTDMEQSYSLRSAKEEDATRIWEIIQQAKAQMYKEEKQQWDEFYPAPEHIADDLIKNYAFVLCYEENIIAYGAVVFDGEPTYKDIQGSWLSDRPYVVVHRLAVADEMKRRGIATIFMREVEKLCVERNIHSFKVDTNFDNFYMQKILEKCGFTYCGEIVFQGGARIAYEKLL